MHVLWSWQPRAEPHSISLATQPWIGWSFLSLSFLICKWNRTAPTSQVCYRLSGRHVEPRFTWPAFCTRGLVVTIQQWVLLKVLRSVCPAPHHPRTPPPALHQDWIPGEKIKLFLKHARNQLGLDWSWVWLRHSLGFQLSVRSGEGYIYPLPLAVPSGWASEPINVSGVRETVSFIPASFVSLTAPSNFLEQGRHSVDEEDVPPQSK